MLVHPPAARPPPAAPRAPPRRRATGALSPARRNELPLRRVLRPHFAAPIRPGFPGTCSSVPQNWGRSNAQTSPQVHAECTQSTRFLFNMPRVLQAWSHSS